jgi:hypothetical protein
MPTIIIEHKFNFVKDTMEEKSVEVVHGYMKGDGETMGMCQSDG